MQPNLTPRVGGPYGAPMGRPGSLPAADDAAADQRFYLARIRINQGGYDDGGAYWGLGPPLYGYESEDGELSGYLRAHSREDAKAQVRERFPRAKFWR